MKSPSTATLAAIAVLLAVAVTVAAVQRGFLDGPLFAQANSLSGTGTGSSSNGSSSTISSREIVVVDGDTIRARGRTVRLVGFDAPESGSLARCDHERELADRAAARLRDIVAAGDLALRLVRCSCPTDTEGTSACNYGRACGVLLSSGRDVGPMMIESALARPYICKATSCPPRGSWC